MLKIAICDDDAGDRERIAEDLRVYAAAHQEHSIEMTVYSSAFAMLDAFEKAAVRISPCWTFVCPECWGQSWRGTSSGAAKIRTFFS